MSDRLPKTFRHGVHPRDHKDPTADLPIERMPFVGTYVLPLGQHIGAPARAIVRPGDQVQRGQCIAEAGGFVSTSLHAPVTGRVTAVAPRRHPNGELVESIEIEADPYSPQTLPPPQKTDWRALEPKAFVQAVQDAGLVGLGGAAFPSHVKYAVKEEQTVRNLVLNGCECEPFLTCDHRVMVERPEAVLRGAEILAARLGASATSIGVEQNKPAAIEAMRKALDAGRAASNGTTTEVVPLEVKYPQGAEKLLVRAMFKVEIPPGKLPIDEEMVVNNVGTMAALADWFDRGVPLIERVLTVSGSGIRSPANLMVPIGTPIRAVLDHCGGLTDGASMVVMGGPMMGAPVASLDAPVLKGTSGLLAFTDADTALPSEYTCVKCGRCLEACPYFLNPSRLGRLSRAERYDDLPEAHVADCMECGACTYSCPSGIPIVQLIRVAKSTLRARGKK